MCPALTERTCESPTHLCFFCLPEPFCFTFCGPNTTNPACVGIHWFSVQRAYFRGPGLRTPGSGKDKIHKCVYHGLECNRFSREAIDCQGVVAQIQIVVSPTLSTKFSTHRREEQSRVLVPQWPLGRSGLQLAMRLHPADRGSTQQTVTMQSSGTRVPDCLPSYSPPGPLFSL